MGALKALIQRLHAQAATPVTRAVPPAVTPVTPQNTAGVTEKFNEINGVTPVTRVTPKFDKGQGSNAKPPAAAPIPAPAVPGAEAANEAELYDWHELDRAYLDHHMQCTQCKTAGRRRGERCAIGAALWRDYEQAMPTWATKG